MLNEEIVRDALREVEDPEFPVSIVDLGLIRGIRIEGSTVEIRLTYTSFACPCTHMIKEDVENRLLEVPGLENVIITEVFEKWSRENISPEGRQLLSAVAVV